MWQRLFSARFVDRYLPDHPELDPDERREVSADCAAYLAAALARAPLHLRAGAYLLSVLQIALLALPWGGSREARMRRLARLGPFRLTERLHRTLTVLAFNDHAIVAAKAGWPTQAERQARYRGRFE